MAIQERRGNYADLDTSKLVQGEPFVTLDKVGGDYYAGIAIAPNNVIRFATWDNLVDIKQDCIDAKDDAETAATNAAASETAAGNSALDSEAWAVGQKNGVDVPNTDPRYENNSKYYAQQAGTYWGYVDTAVNVVVPTVTIDFTTGNLVFNGSQWVFYIDTATGNLMWNIVTSP